VYNLADVVVPAPSALPVPGAVERDPALAVAGLNIAFSSPGVVPALAGIAQGWFP
jgi:hypothetical protein